MSARDAVGRRLASLRGQNREQPMSQPHSLTYMEVAAQAKGQFLFERGADVLQVTYEETTEYGKKVRPYAAELEYRYYLWCPKWYEFDFDLYPWAEADKRGWRNLERPEAQRFIDGSTPDDIDAARMAECERLFDRIAETRKALKGLGL